GQAEEAKVTRDKREYEKDQGPAKQSFRLQVRVQGRNATTHCDVPTQRGTLTHTSCCSAVVAKPPRFQCVNGERRWHNWTPACAAERTVMLVSNCAIVVLH